MTLTSRCAVERVSGLRRLRHLAYFAATLIGAVGPLLVIPVTAELGGRVGFTDYALAMAVGSTLGIVVNCAWGVTGPTIVAQCGSASAARSMYCTTLAVRIPVALVVVPLAGILTWWLADSHETGAALYAMGGATGGLCANWFFVGLQKPALLVLLDALPRLAGLVTGCAIAWVSRELWTLGASVLITELGIAALAAVSQRVSPRQIWRAHGQVPRELREQAALMGSQLTGQATARLALPSISALGASPLALAQFAAGARLNMLARTGLRPFLNIFQAWVAKAPGARARKATTITLGVGLIGAAAVVLVLPPFGHLLFRDAVEISHSLATIVAFGVVALAATYSASLFYLVPRGDTGTIARSETVCSILGLIMICACAVTVGGLPALAAAAATQAAIACWQWARVLTTQ